MSKSIKIMLGLALLTFVAACASRDEEVILVDPTPIEAEPMSNKL